ncbi:MAG TPA: hypothetical protein PKW55_04270 [Spirochaetota bacterium]|nr:hypothetical protein [Spirochaetota bacterium]HPQ48752.1 hypothetical protein [Spirochaetota bacterium]
MNSITIDALNLYYRELNFKIKEAVRKEGIKKVIIKNARGQRFIGTGLKEKDVEIIIESGVPGNDLAMFMDGPTVKVFGNAQDGVGNTMNNGKVFIHGDAGDVICYGMRNGKIFIKGNVGYRVGIHMKEYKDMIPSIVVGGKAGDFFGEYMAGGIGVVLGLNNDDKPIVGRYCATGMHGGVIYIRTEKIPTYLGKEVKIFELNESDKEKLKSLIEEFCQEFKEYKAEDILKSRFIKLIPVSKRPYGRLYSPGNHFPLPEENYFSNKKIDIEKKYY